MTHMEPTRGSAAERWAAKRELLLRDLVTGLQQIASVTPRLKDKREAAKVLAAIWKRRPDLRPKDQDPRSGV